MWFPNRSDTNRPVQAQKKAKSLKFRIYVEEELYYPSSENKGADQLRGYREADLRLCFRLSRLLVFPWGGSFVLLFKAPVNNFLAMSRWSQSFLGLAQGHKLVPRVGIEPRTSGFGVQCYTTRPPRSPNKRKRKANIFSQPKLYRTLSIADLLAYGSDILP